MGYPDEDESAPMTVEELAAEIVRLLNSDHSDKRICSAMANGRQVTVSFFDQKAMPMQISSAE